MRKGTTMKQGDVNGSEAGQQQNSAETEREPTKAELEAEFDPNDEGRFLDSFFFRMKELSISQHYYEPTYWAVANLEAPGWISRMESTRRKVNRNDKHLSPLGAVDLSYLLAKKRIHTIPAFESYNLLSN